MFSLYKNIRADFIKLKATAFPIIHYIMAILGVFTFVCFFKIYGNMDINKKVDIVLELLAMIFPILIGIVSALLILQEEKTSKFQVMFIGNKLNAYLSKFIVLHIYEIIASILITGLFAACLKIFFPAILMPYKIFVYGMIALVFGNIEIYVLHLFVNFKFGMGSSIFLGVLESLLTVLFSNVNLGDKWVYIPFSWSIILCKKIINGEELWNKTQYNMYIIILITTLSIVASLVWFKHWEGRKTYE